MIIYRRHNFYLIDDITRLIKIRNSELLEVLNGLSLYTITAGEFVEQVSQSQIVSVPNRIRDLPPDFKIHLVPDCVGIQSLLDLSVYNMDD